MKYEEVDCIYIDLHGNCTNCYVKKNIFGIRRCPKLIANFCGEYVGPTDKIKRTSKKLEVEFQCKCGKASGWVSEGETTKKGCPECGRRYRGKYDNKTNTLVAVEVK